MTFEQKFISILSKRIGALLAELGLHPGDAKLMAKAAYAAAVGRRKGKS
jgi:hypothetical protein